MDSHGGHLRYSLPNHTHNPLHDVGKSAIEVARPSKATNVACMPRPHARALDEDDTRVAPADESPRTLSVVATPLSLLHAVMTSAGCVRSREVPPPALVNTFTTSIAFCKGSVSLLPESGCEDGGEELLEPRTRSAFRCAIARSKGVRSRASIADGFAPARSNRLTTGARLPCAATWRTVAPSAAAPNHMHSEAKVSGHSSSLD